MGDNLSSLNNGGNGDSVPASVPAPEPHACTTVARSCSAVDAAGIELAHQLASCSSVGPTARSHVTTGHHPEPTRDMNASVSANHREPLCSAEFLQVGSDRKCRSRVFFDVQLSALFGASTSPLLAPRFAFPALAGDFKCSLLTGTRAFRARCCCMDLCAQVLSGYPVGYDQLGRRYVFMR
jgi:hypothetical protein